VLSLAKAQSLGQRPWAARALPARIVRPVRCGRPHRLEWAVLEREHVRRAFAASWRADAALRLE